MTYCSVCPPGRDRIPRRPAVCDACRSWLASVLDELPGYVDELLVRQLDLDSAPHRAGVDLVADLMPAASIASKAKAPRITGSRERPAPLPLNIIDLTANARYNTVTDSFGDQTGEHAVLTILDTWVRELRQHRHKGEGLPLLSPRHLADWLLLRLDEACDTFESVADMAGEVRHLRGALRATLGLAGPDTDLKDGVYCPRCDHQELYHQTGSQYIECGNCPALLTLDEFSQWVKLSSANLVYLRGMTCETCRRGQMYRIKGTAMPRCGWCEWHILIAEADQSDESEAA
jgi:hypothetical protein